MKILRPPHCFLLLLFVIALSACDTGREWGPPPVAEDPWRPVNPLHSGVQINDLWGTSIQHVMAVGRYGLVMVKSGQDWQVAPVPTNSDIFSIHGCDWQNIWAICREGVLFFDGESWAMVRTERYSTNDQVWCRAPDDVMIVTAENLSFHFDGERWLRQVLPLKPTVTEVADGRRANWMTGWWGGFTIVGRDGAVATWTGGVWQPAESVGDDVSLSHIVSDEGTPPDFADYSIWVFGRDAELPNTYVAYKKDQYQSWVSSYSFVLPGRLIDIVQGAGHSSLYAVSVSTANDSVFIQRTPYAQQGIALPGHYNARVKVYPDLSDWRQGNDRFVVAGSQGIFYDGNFEEGMTSRTGGVPFRAMALHAWPNGDFSAVGDKHDFLHGRDGDLNWQIEDIPTGLSALWGPDPALVYAVGRYGMIVQLTPGSSPIAMASPTSEHLSTVSGSGPNNVWAAGSGVLLHYDGTMWNVVPGSESLDPQRIISLGPEAVLVQEHEQILKWDGSQWSVVMTVEDLLILDMAADPDGESVFIVVADYHTYSALYRYRDGVIENLGVTPHFGRSLAVLAHNELLIASRYEVMFWRDGQWSSGPHPSHYEFGQAVPRISGTTTGGVYSTDFFGLIKYLNLEGPLQWR